MNRLRRGDPRRRAQGRHEQSPDGRAERDAGPVIGRFVVRRLVPADRRNDIVGDLGELYAERARSGPLVAWLWYWRQVFDFAARFGRQKWRPTVAGFRARISVRSFAAALPASSDLKLALRMARKTPTLTLIAVAAMAVGIGLTVSGFTVVQAVFHAELPFPGGERIVRLENYYGRGSYGIRTDAELFEERRRALSSFEYIVGYAVRRVGVVAGDDETPQVIGLAYATADLFDMLGVEARIGRAFGSRDADAAAPAVVVIGDALWRALGADPDVVGQMVMLDGESHIVIGVMPKGFLFPSGQQAWVPIDPRTARGAAARLWTVGKLKVGTDPAVAQSEWAAVASRRAAQEGYSVDDLVPRIVSFTRPSEETEAVSLAATAFFVLVLLLTAANVANLFVARSAARADEMAVRAALGGGRARIVGQLVVEALVVGTAAAVIGVAASRPALDWLRVRGDMPWWTRFDLDFGVVVFAAAVSVIASLLAGVPAAVKATGRSLESALGDRSKGAEGLRFGRLSRILLVGQATVSIGFLGAAGLLGAGLYRHGQQDFGLPVERVAVAQVYWGQPDASERRADSIAAWERFEQRADASRRRLEERVRRLPDVVAVSSSDGVPGQRWIGWSDRSPVQLEAGIAAGAVVRSNVIAIGADYFDTYGVAPLAGRVFAAADHEDGALAAIVNEPFVRKHFGGTSPLGRRIRVGRGGSRAEIVWRPWLQIVGVVPDIGVDPGDPASADAVYVPLTPRNILLLSIRTRTGIKGLAPLLYDAVTEDEMIAEVQTVYTLRELLDGPAGPLRMVGTVVLFMGAVALLLTACGLYAIMSFSVSRRTREIGVRRALGASPAAVVRTVLGRTVAPLLTGAVLGALLAGAGGSLLAWMLPLEPAAAAGGLTALVVALVMVIGVVGCLVPLRRALAVRPVEALRRG